MSGQGSKDANLSADSWPAALKVRNSAMDLESEEGGATTVLSMSGAATQSRQPQESIRRYTPTSRPNSKSVVHIDVDKHIIYTGQVSPLRGIHNLVICARWYSELGSAVQKNIDRAGFGEVVKVIGLGHADKLLLQALGERWWDTTHTFHFDNVGEMTMTPTDFSGLTGLPVNGKELICQVDVDARFNQEKIERLFGKRMLKLVDGDSSQTWGDLYGEYFNFRRTTKLEIDQLTRVFLLALIGSVLCTEKKGKLNLCFMNCLENIDDISKYNWGGAALASMYKNMDALSRGRSTSGCIWKLWEVWACLYVKPLADASPVSEDSWPVASRWVGGKMHASQISDYRGLFRFLRADEVLFNPWGGMDSNIPEYVKNSFAFTSKRVLLHSITGYAWYLGERVNRQSMYFLHPRVPVEPPMSMLGDYPFTDYELEEGTLGWAASDFLSPKDDNYVGYMESFLMYDQYPDTPAELDDPPCGLEVKEITMPPWSIGLAGFRDDCRLHHIDIPRSESSIYYPLPENVHAVSSETADTLLRQIAGLTTVAYTHSVKARDEWMKIKEEGEKLMKAKDEENARLCAELSAAKTELYSIKSLLHNMRSCANRPNSNVNEQGTAGDGAENVDPLEGEQLLKTADKSKRDDREDSQSESCDGDIDCDDDEWTPRDTKTWKLPPKFRECTDSKRSRCS